MAMLHPYACHLSMEDGEKEVACASTQSCDDKTSHLTSKVGNIRNSNELASFASFLKINAMQRSLEFIPHFVHSIRLPPGQHNGS